MNTELSHLHADRRPGIAPGEWVDTTTAKEIADALDTAALLGAVAVVVGPSGVGKSAAVKHYADTRENSFVATISAAERGMVPALVCIATAMGLGYYRQYGAKDMADRIRATMRDGAVLIVDNAEQLPADVLILLGSFTDATRAARGGAIALVGREKLHPAIFGGARSSARQDMNWLESRVSRMLCIKGVPSDDVAAFADSYGVHDEEARALLQEIAARPSAPNMLWALTRVLRFTHAQGKGRAVRAAHVRQAAAALGHRVVG